MSYSGISVREVLEKINSPKQGWFLPQIQRQYVWGERQESEGYVCLLLDSILKGYPIGGLVLWETEQKVPYREFVENYSPRNFARQVDEGHWDSPKSLVYDGQQRLQTLYSCLYYRYNGRVLHYDLLFDSSTAESDESGFMFRDSDACTEPRYLRMTELVRKKCDHDVKVTLEQKALEAAGDDKKLEHLIRVNFSKLWDKFVATSTKSIAYFSVNAEDPKEVNEVFRRLNTGGVALTQIELILSKIKETQPDYEEKLWEIAEAIEKQSGGIVLSSSQILQFFHLLVKNTIRIDEDRLEKQDIEKFIELLTDFDPYTELFARYLNGLFKINHASIVPLWLATLPIAVYLTARKKHGHKWSIHSLSQAELQSIHQYFIVSQFCDWGTQTMINAFAREAMNAGKSGKPFPFEEIRKIAIAKGRHGELSEERLMSRPWLATKILMPGRNYVFHDRKPQVDHIFPIKLAGNNDEKYQKDVDVLWNFQPIPAEVNRNKSARNPKEFFNSEDGSKYWPFYDFIPEPKDRAWDDHVKFIEERKVKMLDALKHLYGLVCKDAIQQNS